MERQTIRFTKMHGAGNDYIYVDTDECPIGHPEALAIEWSRPHFGIGSDGLILVSRSKTPNADFMMRIFNNDGSEAMMCGNGVRCVGKFVADRGLTDKRTVRVDTLSGIKVIQLFENDEGEVDSARVDMGIPLLQNRRQVATASGGLVGEDVVMDDGTRMNGTYVCMGNPHFVVFVDDIHDIDVAAVGARLEHHHLFPQRCNIEFAQLRDDDSIRMRVWERGSGITLACGTGACATAVAAILTKRVGGRRCDIEMDGGTLHIHWDDTDGHLYMTGPATRVFEGKISV